MKKIQEYINIKGDKVPREQKTFPKEYSGKPRVFGKFGNSMSTYGNPVSMEYTTEFVTSIRDLGIKLNT